MYKIILSILVLCSLMQAQTTTVTGTIQYPDGQAFQNGTVLATFTPPTGVINQNQYLLNGNPFPYFVSGTMDGTGTFTISLTDDHQVRPLGGRWNFTVCSPVSVPCANSLQDVFGGSINLGSLISSDVKAVSAPALSLPIFLTDSEVKNNANGGQMYFNYAAKTFRCWDGSSWGVCVGSGGGSTTVPNQLWLLPGIVAPTAVINTTGGSIANSHLITVLYSLLNVTGETLPSALSASLSSVSCVAGVQCSVSVTAPTLPTGYTSYTVYANDSSADLLYHKITGCIAITTGCTITSIGSGSQPLTVGTAYTQPPNAQANNGPYGSVPSIWVLKGDGNYYPWQGIDMFCDNTNGPLCPAGAPVITGRTIFSDLGNSGSGFRNAFISIAHQFGVGTSTTNQDRGVGIVGVTPINDSSSHFAIEGLGAQLNFNCNGCTITGAPDGEVATTSWQLNNLALTSYSSSFGTNAVRATYFRNGVGMDTSGDSAFNGYFANNVSSNPGGIVGTVYRANCTNSFTTQAGLACVTFYSVLTNNRFLNGQIGWLITGNLVPSTGDWLIRNDIHNFPSNLNGNIGLIEIHNTDLGALPLNASLAVTGAVNIAQIPTGWTSGYNGQCSGGASTYGYTVVAVDNNGGISVSASINSGMTTCTNPLTVGNPVTLSPNVVPYATIFAQAARLDVYRTTGPMGLGKVGSFTCANNMPIFGCNAFVDTGLTASGALPSGNTTGGQSISGDFTYQTSKGQHQNTFAANSDYSGILTCAASTASLTFARAYVSNPSIVVSDETTTGGARVSAKSTTAFTITCTGATDVVDYTVSGNPN